MDLNAIATFVKVVEAGSFVAAARTAGVTKSTVARRIDQLEESLGVRLLQRSTRKSELTDAGRSFYERCRRIVADFDDAVANVSAQQIEPRGKLRFSTSMLLGERFMGPWCVEYMQRYPEVELDMFLTARKVDLLADGFDLVIRVSQLESSSHIVRRLAPAPSYLCATPAYLEAHGTPEQPADLERHAFVLFSPDRVQRPLPLTHDSGETAAVSSASRLVTNSYPVALQACLEGFCIAELPVLLCCNELRSGRLVQLLPEWSSTLRWLHALYPSRQYLSATVRTFLSFMSDKLTPAPWTL